MNTVAITILSLTLATFLALGIWFFGFGRRLLWPKGERLKRVTSGGVDVFVILGPGMEALLSQAKKAKVADACRTAIDSCFVAWNKHRPRERAEESIDRLAVEFVTDDEMNRRIRAIWGADRQINGYLWRVSRAQWGSQIPMAVVRGSLFQLVIDRGEPVIHETIHALLGEFSAKGVDRSHSDEAWTKVSIPAGRVYAERVGRAAP